MKKIEHKATIITARYSSSCPFCGFRVNPGEKCKVFYDKWYHLNCWEKNFNNVMDDKKDNEIKSLKSEISFLKENLADIHSKISSILESCHSR